MTIFQHIILEIREAKQAVTGKDLSPHEVKAILEEVKELAFLVKAAEREVPE